MQRKRGEKNMNGEASMTIFLHIPKTGGTTLNRIFQRQFINGELFDHNTLNGKARRIGTLNTIEKKKIKAVAGHYKYGVHQFFSTPHNYFTMVRNPVERVISSYYFLLEFKGDESVNGMSLEQFVRDDPKASNLQTKLICGNMDSPDLKAAIKNVKDFKMVGITERFDESLYFLQKEYGWRNIHYTKENITKKRLARKEVPDAIIKQIKINNALDFELYRTADAWMNQRISLLSNSEKNKLTAFKQRIN
jgi:Sulfotransferase family